MYCMLTHRRLTQQVNNQHHTKSEQVLKEYVEIEMNFRNEFYGVHSYIFIACIPNFIQENKIVEDSSYKLYTDLVCITCVYNLSPC